MKLSNSFINTLRQTSFKADFNKSLDKYIEEDENILGYDDAISAERRKYIRI